MKEGNLEEIVKETVIELVSKMGFEVEVEIEKGDGETLVCNIRTEESSFLIGQYGINLQSLQHIARLLVRQKFQDRADFVLDVNSYRREKNSSIIKMAQEVARQCLLEKRAVVLRPMSPYERRIVHLELSKMEEIKTESIGEGEDRRVVIKPADLV
ncbi:MAG: spoIIIJ-associated protein [Patescibacteria group bacterium]|nr:spoIIIJ-associated protein [Patescibacteria group bacterium]